MNLIEQIQQVLGDYDLFLKSLLVTLIIAMGAVVLGFIVGVLCAVARIAPKTNIISKFFDKVAGVYITVIRGTPTLLQLLIIANVLLIGLYNSSTNILVPIVAFGLNSGAYMAEIIRSGFNSVPQGQMEAGRSLGLTWGATVKSVIIPQAIKTVVPSIFNEIIVLVKETSVVSIIAIMVGNAQVYDLLGLASRRGLATHNYMAYLITAALIYLAVVMMLTAIQKVIERRFAKSDRH